jgi:hypothetical protein
MSQSLFRLSIRDVLWLTLLVAEVVAAVQTHYRDEEELLYWRRQSSRADMRFALLGPVSPKPSKELIAEREKLKTLSDEELIARLNAVIQSRNWTDSFYDYCLSEMVRRKMVPALAKHYEFAAESHEILTRTDWSWPRSLEALTAWRRSTGDPDPVRIQLSVSDVADAPALRVALTNVDSESVDFVPAVSIPQRGQWRVVMTNAAGQEVAESNAPMSFSDGIFDDHLAAGGCLEWEDVDLRRFLAPPRSGRYQVRMLYHDLHLPASGFKRSGLIYFESEPLTVEVDNPNDPLRISLEGAIPLTIALVPVGLLVSGWIIARRRGNRAFVWRDVAWCVVILAIGIVWFGDQQHLWQQIREALPHEEAGWTIEAVKS